MTLKIIRVPLIAVFLMATLFSCGGKREADRKTEHDVRGKVLATVNGVPITEEDVKLGLKRAAHGEAVAPEANENVLRNLVRNELVYQQSVELGLENDPEYGRKLQEAESQLRAFQRQEMVAVYKEYVKNKAEVTDAEAREYFEKNRKKIQTKLHVWQIYSRGDEARIAQDRKELNAGKSFEKVASKRFPDLPKGMNAPWDIGYLHWFQIPPAWQGVLERLAPGGTSEIIKGPNERFWVIRLVDKAVDPKITFATEREKIVDVLRKRKADELQESMLNRMREKSRIVFPK